jgi:hypothetical protein
MYAKVRKSGDKLLINIPKEHRNDFPYLTPVKVISLGSWEEQEKQIKPEMEEEILKAMTSFEAARIIRDMDKNYDIKDKGSAELIEYANKLIKEETRE